MQIIVCLEIPFNADAESRPFPEISPKTLLNLLKLLKINIELEKIIVN